MFVVISKPVLHPHVPSVVVTLLHAPFVIVSQCALSSLLHVDPIITKLKRRINIGDFVLPIGAIRGDGTSNDYFPPEVPAMPSFSLQKAISTTIREFKIDYWTGTVYTTNRRIWEYDSVFKEYLKKTRAYAIDMETATLFTVGFHNKIPTGALLLTSDSPMTPEGVKTLKKDEINSRKFDKKHIEIGISSLKKLMDNAETVRHLKF